ncbi:polymer-forming cytoskeletal protein [Butyrivibrio sp. NC2002]|uniref:polymer-forming cytoskeletal protein n=1 Tax=Butyrivibrio sp. NC2002 TaxID=1410610 RepID=UPI000560B1B6|nr:polymer-forming cytoskeletal protein [Butyrivibrio sp. NC2002]
MGFFSELKSDLSQAAKTIIPEESEDAKILNDTAGEDTVKKSEADVKKDLNEMLEHLDEIKLSEEVEAQESEASESVSEEPASEKPAAGEAESEASIEETTTEETVADLTASVGALDTLAGMSASMSMEKEEEVPVEAPKKTTKNNRNYGGFETMDIQQQTPTDETASITEGMKIVGNLETTGSLELVGKITGNVTCLGKLNVTGEIEGDSKAAEIYAEAARITGEVRSQGSVKIGQSTVVIGNIFATSAVIAGAVKGDIDVPGPVVLDTTAIVMGNIKSQSVQINNGAVIEGNCSQSYAEVNPSAFFEGLKGTK